jgi:hypothetical protein
MAVDLPAYLEQRRRFLANRAAVSVEELAKYAGEWVAWSPDGSRVVAHARSPELLDGLVRACGEDPACCVVEGIPGDDGLFDEAGGDAARSSPTCPWPYVTRLPL